MKTLGPTFGDELKVAGLTGLPFTWGPDGQMCFAPTMTTQQLAAVNAVIAAHNPAAVVPPKPDLNGFMADVIALFPRRKLRKLISAATLSAFQRQDVAAIKADIDEMYADAEITLAERTTLYANAQARGLPGF